MSFILDALKKSETDRQQQASAEFASVPTSDGSPRAPRWLWALGALLVINLAVLLALVLRSDDATPANIATAQQTLPVERNRVEVDDAEASFAAKVEQAQRNQPEPRVVAVAAPRQTAITASEDNGRPLPAATARLSANETARLPTVQELIVNGTVDIPDLHLDIHVYSDNPEERFVFINMSKQREQSQLREGPMVREITPDGVVLTYRGTSFVLRRD